MHFNLLPNQVLQTITSRNTYFFISIKSSHLLIQDMSGKFSRNTYVKMKQQTEGRRSCTKLETTSLERLKENRERTGWPVAWSPRV